jgi:hypothetical protein
MKKRIKVKKGEENIHPDANIQIPDDIIKPVTETKDENPRIYSISKRGKSLNRKNFVKSAASVAGLAALGNLLKSCEESELDIVKKAENCTCHAVCTCNTDWEEGKKYDKGNTFESRFDNKLKCTCDTVCTCNSVCSCNSVCTCDTEGSGGGGGGTYYYTYWYPC